MNKELIIRAWKDPRYRASLSSEQRTALPESPSGKPMTELEESDLDLVAGGLPPSTRYSCWLEVCGSYTF